MAIQETFKAVLSHGIELSAGQDTPFIDIADLDENDTSFFTEGGADSVAESIVAAVNRIPTNLRPVICFLRGTPDGIDEGYWKSRQPSIEAILWERYGGNVTPRITHPNAELHYGIYSPNFKLLSASEHPLRFKSALFQSLAANSNKCAKANGRKLRQDCHEPGLEGLSMVQRRVLDGAEN
jgi:hypothetical protein